MGHSSTERLWQFLSQALLAWIVVATMNSFSYKLPRNTSVGNIIFGAGIIM